jgi:signal peptidase II
MSLIGDLAVRKRYFGFAAVIIVLDQATKIAAHALLPGREAVEVIPGFMNLAYSRNPGGLFGLFGTWSTAWRTTLLTLLPIAAVILIGLFLARTREQDRRTMFGMAMILGGATGNLIDRVFRGEVVDFLDVYAPGRFLSDWFVKQFGTAHWPTFNIADSAIVLGAGLLILDILRPGQPAEPEE